ncbi:MAG: protein kinase [Proteobacteria bacterium]|nr:protein kinase [Pseudomonadota bacterium]
MTYNRTDHPETNEMIGQRYLIVRQLREEPWGGVWLAQDNTLRTEVSLKLLARDAPEWTAARDMFEHAAVLGLKLRHPQILGVFHVDKADKFLYLVEEPFPGESLMAQWVRQERFSLPQALHRLELLTQALAFAHQQGEVHQFLSPLNILLQGEDLRLANFAFAPAYGDEPQHLELRAYAPPEVIHGDRLTPAGNVFSLGVLGFRLVAGSLPYPLTFDEPFPYRLEYPPADLEEIPVPLQNVLLRCLAEDPEERLPHAGALVSQLHQARELMHGVTKKAAAWRPEKSRRSWQPLAQAGPQLKKVWEHSLPHAQKVRDAARSHLNTLKLLPRRLLWGVGLAVLTVALIIFGVKVGYRPASKPQPATVAAPVALPPTGGGPPLIESGEAGAPGGPGPAARPAAGPTPAPVQSSANLASPGSKDQRYLLLVATYNTMKQAEVLQQRLRAKHLRAVIKTRKTGSKTLYQVRVGPLTGAKAAEDAANRIKTLEKINPKVVKLAPKTAGTNKIRRPSR